jgi:chromosome segregation protein
VQSAKNAQSVWEQGNREQALEKDRLDIRRAEIVHQIEQAGRRAEEFASAVALTDEDASLVALAEVERRMFRLRGDLAAMGEVDAALVKEARDTEARHAFLAKESKDLHKAVADLTGLMTELTEKITHEFEGSLRHINKEFEKFFGLMFGGGYAKLKLAPRPSPLAPREEGQGKEAIDEPTESEADEEANLGVEIEVRLPRKKINSLDMLSGGERSLVGIAALFALVSVSPPPFLVLDEIDAPLDDRNARRFAEMLKDFSKRTQFIVVTHNRATMEAADILYGVTLNDDGTSKILSLKLEPEAAAATS